MLSRTAAKLTHFILARHSLICRAVELESTVEAHSIVRAARDGAGVDQGVGQQLCAVSPDRAALAELMLLPELISMVEESIVSGWERLGRVRR